MKKIPGIVLAAIALLVIGILWLSWRDKAVRAEAAQRQHDATLDSLVRVEKQRTTVDSLRLERQRDSTWRVIRDLERRAALRRAVVQPPTDTSVHSVAVSAPDVRDSLIASLLSGRQQDSLQLLFWKAQVAQRDSLIPMLQRARDAWRQRSERRFACGAGAAVTIGLDGKAAIGPSVGCYVKL